MGLSDQLRNKAEPIWDQILNHKFITGLGDGSLPLDRFKFYLRQDYLFLVEYARVLAIASAKAPNLEGMTRFATLLHATLSQEMNLHRRYCAGFGINEDDLKDTKISPATSNYANYLLAVAHQDTVREIAASLLPCQWGYYEIGLKLAAEGDLSDSNPYAEWIKTYSSEEFRDLTDWLRGYLDKLGQGISPANRKHLEETFLMSCRYEYQFWQMGLSKESWLT